MLSLRDEGSLGLAATLCLDALAGFVQDRQDFRAHEHVDLGESSFSNPDLIPPIVAVSVALVKIFCIIAPLFLAMMVVLPPPLNWHPVWCGFRLIPSPGIPKKSLVGLKRTWDQKLSSGLMLVMLMTTHFSQFGSMSYSESRTIKCAESYSTNPSTLPGSSPFVVLCAENRCKLDIPIRIMRCLNYTG